MSEERIARYEHLIEEALWESERDGLLDEALEVYRDAIEALTAMSVDDPDLDGRRLQTLSYAWMRLANGRRQQGSVDEARRADDEGLRAARRAGDSLALGRALLSAAGTGFAEGDGRRGTQLLEQARGEFQKSDDVDHIQGLGWCHVLIADVGNAGLLPLAPDEVVEATNEALQLLEPIENWPGIARAHAAKAVALEAQGDHQAALDERRSAEAAEERSQKSG